MARKQTAVSRLYTLPHGGKPWQAAAIGAGLLAAIAFIAQAIVMAQVIHRVFRLNQTLRDVASLLGAMLALIVLRAALLGGQELLAQRAATLVKGDLRQRLTAHILHLGPIFARGERSGELVNTAVAGVETLNDVIVQYLPARLLAMVVPALVFLTILILDPWTTLVLLFAGPMLILLLALIGGRAREQTERRFAEMSWMSAHFLDILQGLPTLKRYGRSREQVESIRAISERFATTTMDVLRTAFQTSLVLEWAATAATALVALEVGLRIMANALTFDRGLAVLLLTPEFFLPLRQLSLAYHAGKEGEAAAKRIFAVLDTQPKTTPSANGHGRGPAARTVVATAPAVAAIRFDNVYLAYADGQRPALRGLSFTIAARQTVALVGPTGAGKSTAASLLLRFLEPESGAITVANTPLHAIDAATWRAQVAWVPQHPHLFHGTIAENMRLGNPNADDAAIIAAARAANAHDFITGLPHSYDTAVGEQGMRLSGGQRQRLAIARAFLKDAPFLILDEATAHLDTVNETAIREALRRLLHGRTALIIAHRLRLAYDADQIIVLEQGRAVDRGAHVDLLARPGLYRQMVHTYEGIG